LNNNVWQILDLCIVFLFALFHVPDSQPVTTVPDHQQGTALTKLMSMKVSTTHTVAAGCLTYKKVDTTLYGLGSSWK